MTADEQIVASYRSGAISRQQAVMWLMIGADEPMEDVPVAERFSVLKAMKEKRLDEATLA